MPENRFLHPYYLLNVLLCAAYAALRVQRLSGWQLAHQDMFGISREQQIYFCLFLMLITRAMSAPTVDAYLASAFSFARVAILVCLWHMDTRLAVLFLVLWTLIYALCPQPRFRLPPSIATLTTPSFNQRIANNNHRTIYVLWCHASWSARCSQLAPVLASLAKAYSHPRVRFARIDVSKFPDTAEKLGLSISPNSKQLPCVICFKQGKEVGRIPTTDRNGNISKDWYRGFKAGHVAQALNLKIHINTAREWEKEARQRLKKSD